MSPETKAKALEKLATFNPKIGYPDKWKDYTQGADRPRRLLGERGRGPRSSNVEDDRAPDRQARRPRPLGHDAADLERLLQPAPERDRLPRRHPAAAGLRHGRDRRGELRRHRRRDRPRDQPRLRRPGRAVRRPGPAARTGGPPADLEKFQERGQCVVDQFEGYFIEPGHPPQRQAGARRVDRRPRRREDRLPRLPEVAARASRPAPTIDGFTPEQQFFIAWGQFRGDAIRPETAAR